jgi:inhibitor of cysteine peptidase
VLGCTNTSQASAPPSPGSATPLLSDLSLGKADNGKRYEFYKGSTIRISLEGNPTTGYLWGLLPETVNDLVLKPSADYSFSPDSPALTGSGGTFVFDFMAANPGEAKLVFGYRRSWESDPPAETWSITVKVNDVHSAADPER